MNMHSQVLQDQGQLKVVPSLYKCTPMPVDVDWATISEVMQLLRYTPKTMPGSADLLFRRRRIRAGQTLFTMEQDFDGFYVIRMGTFKSIIRDDDGAEHVISFSARGDVLGADGVCNDRYQCEAVALTTCEVIRVSSDRVFSSQRANDDVEKLLYWAISREISRELMAYALAHSSRSEIRVAKFLLSQSARFAANGWSARRFTLPMSRRDIGNYLNVTLETVSRAFSSLHQQGIIQVAMRDITICSMEALRDFEG